MRRKLFALLAAVALVSLGALAALDYYSGLKLADREALARRDSLLADLKQLLGSSVDANAQYLNQQANIVSLALEVQAAAVERELDRPPPDVPLYFAGRFDGPRAGWPPQTALERLGGAPDAIPASYAVGSVLVPDGIDAAAVRPDLLRLAATFPVLRAIATQHPGLFAGQFTALENGARSNYPGHGGFPRGYDSRKRSWYIAAATAGKAVWTPVFSATTEQLTFIASMPVRGRNGRFAGVAADEIAIVTLLRELGSRAIAPDRRPAMASLAQAAENVAAVLVTPQTNAEGDADALRILAQRSYNQTAMWNVTPSFDTIAGRGKPAYDAVVADVQAGRSGVARLPYDGRDSLWAYGPVPAFSAALLLVLPYDRVLAAAEAGGQSIRDAARDQLRETLLLSVAILSIVAVVAYGVAAVATRGIRELAVVAGRIGGGDLGARAPVHGHDEVAALAASFNAMVPKLQDGLRMQHGLELARAVQQNLLPSHPPAVAGFDLAGASVYCDETGGDYYDFVDLPRGTRHAMAVAIGDVSGHGVSSALLMASVRAALHGSIDGGEAPRLWMERANRLLCADVQDGSFMTLLLLLVDPAAATVRWVNAAHDPPVLYHVAGDAFLPADGGDIPIGIDADWSYSEHELALPAGDVVLAVGTDGIWETENAQGEQFGRERFRALVRAHAAQSAGALCSTILEEVARYRGSLPAADDVTLVIVKFAVALA